MKGWGEVVIDAAYVDCKQSSGKSLLSHFLDCWINNDEITPRSTDSTMCTITGAVLV